MKKLVKFGVCVSLVASMLMTNLAYAANDSKVPEEKTDEILVETDVAGSIKSVKANVTLIGADAASPIRDNTVLNDIVNIGGGETFTQNGDGSIVWENKGDTVRYSGTLNSELPFSMNVKYYLDDKEIAPSEIAGKSGRVKVVYAFENNKMIDVDVDGETYTTYVPLTAITSLVLPMEKFQNVEALDGGLVVKEFGDTYFLMGVAVPGTNDALNLEAIGLDKYVNFPESFGFTADVTEFEMPSTITSVSPHVVDKLNLSKIETSEDVDKQIDQLLAATRELVSGSDKLAGGTSKLSDGVSKFVSEFQKGLSEISKGSAKLNNELYDLEDKKAVLQKQASELLTYLDSILTQLNGFELPDADSVFPPELMDAETKLKEDAQLLVAALETLKKQLEEIQAFAVEAQDYIDQMTAIGNTVYEELSSIDLDKMVAEATELAKKQALQAAKEEFGGLGIPDDQLEVIINKIMSHIDISSVANEAKVHVEKVKAVLSDIPEIEIPDFQVDVDPIITILKDMETNFTVLESAAEKQDDLVGLLDSANKFMSSVKEDSVVLRKKSNALISGLDFADSAIKNAHEYINSLRDALSEAEQGSDKLVDGTKQLDEGAKKLAEGTEKYYKEGIISATDFARQATLKAFLVRCKALIAAGKKYINITGIDSTTRGSISFIVRTEGIAAFNE